MCPSAPHDPPSGPGASPRPGDAGPLVPPAEGAAGRSPGRLVGVGVGPGDPRLVTLQALQVLRAADRVVAPVTAVDAPGRAETIVRQAAPDLHIDRLPFDMTPDTAPGGASARAATHRRAAEALLQWVDAGETVAFVTLGDPNVYSTFPSVAAIVAEERPAIRVDTVPGICAFQALAAASGTVLLDGVDTLALVTAVDGVDHLRRALAGGEGAVVVYKGGRHLPEVAKVLADHGRLAGAVFGELLGLPGERVAPLAELADDPAAYLATVIVPPARPDRGAAGPGPAEGDR